MSELRALSPRLDVPPAAEQAITVRQRLEARQRPEARPPLIARWRGRILYPRWRAALIVALTVVALAVAIPQSRAVIAHVLRLDGVELRQAPGPSPAPHPSLPGEQRMPLERVFPNPVTRTASIAYELKTAAAVELVVYNARGQRVRRLHSGAQPAGLHLLRWDTPAIRMRDGSAPPQLVEPPRKLAPSAPNTPKKPGVR